MDDGALVTITNKYANEPSCEYWHGMLQGALELTKTKGTIEVDKSRLEKDKLIVYTMKW